MTVIPHLMRDPRFWIFAYIGGDISNMIKFIKILKIVSIFTLFVLVFSFAAFGIQDTDVAQYLANGKYIVQHYAVPHANIFAYPNLNYGMVADEWLFHTVVYGIYLLAGFTGLAIFQIAIVVAIFVLLYFAGRRARLSVLLPILLVVILAAHERFMLRADLMSLLFVTAYIYILEKYQQEKTKLIYALPFLQLVWANFHGFWILGLIIMAIYLFSELAAKIWRKTFNSIFDYKLLVIFIISILVGFVNPYGLAGFKVPFERLTELGGSHSALLDFNADFYSPFSNTNEARHLSVLIYKILLALSLGILILRIKKISLRHGLLYLAFLLMSLNFIRNIPMFAIVVGFILPQYLDDFVGKIKLYLSEKKSEMVHGLVLTVFIVSTIGLSYWLVTNKFYLSEGRTRRSGIALNSFVFPSKAVEFVKENKLAGPLFNDYNIGSYLNWRLYPEQSAFIDGRTNSYDIKFLEDYFKIMAGLAPYQDVALKHNINYFILNHKSNDTKIIIPKLYHDSDWVLVYFDELSVIFVKNNETNQEIIKKYAIDFKTGKNFDSDNVGVKSNDDLFVARNLRGEFFLNLGLYSEARHEFSKALEILENNAIVYNNLGIVEQHLGNLDAALVAFEQATEINKNFAQAHFNLANIYTKKEQWPEAAGEYERALRFDSSFVDAYLNLGAIYRYHLNNPEKAKYYWQTYLEKYPASPQATAVQAEIDVLQ